MICSLHGVVVNSCVKLFVVVYPPPGFIAANVSNEFVMTKVVWLCVFLVLCKYPRALYHSCFCGLHVVKIVLAVQMCRCIITPVYVWWLLPVLAKCWRGCGVVADICVACVVCTLYIGQCQRRIM